MAEVQLMLQEDPLRREQMDLATLTRGLKPFWTVRLMASLEPCDSQASRRFVGTI